MTKEQAVVYLSFSGFSDEQIKVIEGAFNGWGSCVSSNPQKPICPSAGVDCEDCPAYEKKTGWIPVSEDLPKDAYGCIVTVMDVDLKTQNEFENILPYFVGYDGETWNNADGEPIPYEVIAWMKAPEPYKAEGSGE